MSEQAAAHVRGVEPQVVEGVQADQIPQLYGVFKRHVEALMGEPLRRALRQRSFSAGADRTETARTRGRQSQALRSGGQQLQVPRAELPHCGGESRPMLFFQRRIEFRRAQQRQFSAVAGRAVGDVAGLDDRDAEILLRELPRHQRPA